MSKYPPIRRGHWPKSVIREYEAVGLKEEDLADLYWMGEGRHRISIHVKTSTIAEEEYRYLGISRYDYPPTWEEIKHIQNEIYPGVFMSMPMPPSEYWMSVAPNMYHLWEVRDWRLIGQWKATWELTKDVPEGTTIGGRNVYDVRGKPRGKEG